MPSGKVKWYDEIKGFGFIIAEDGNQIFVHRSGLISPFGGLQADQEVRFKTRRGDRGDVAFNVE